MGSLGVLLWEGRTLPKPPKEPGRPEVAIDDVIGTPVARNAGGDP